MLVFMSSTRYSRPKLMKLEFSRQMVKKYSNTKFHKNPFNGSTVVPYGEKDERTDRYDGAHT